LTCIVKVYSVIVVVVGGGTSVVVGGGVVVVGGGGGGDVIFIDAPEKLVVIKGQGEVASFMVPEIPMVATFPGAPVMVKAMMPTVPPAEPLVQKPLIPAGPAVIDHPPGVPAVTLSMVK
jgi:hypothetical protein